MSVRGHRSDSSVMSACFERQSGKALHYRLERKVCAARVMHGWRQQRFWNREETLSWALLLSGNFAIGVGKNPSPDIPCDDHG